MRQILLEETDMQTDQKLASSGAHSDWLCASRRPSAGLVHLRCMDTNRARITDFLHSPTEVLTLSQLAHYLGVPAQTLYDLRSQGRGPRGFRVGRELRFRRAEVDAWLARMEEADAARHPGGEGQ